MAELTYRDAVARGIAQEMARDPDVILLRRGRRQAWRRLQGDGRALRAVRSQARARHADLRTGDHGRRDGCADDRAASRSPKSCSRISSRSASIRQSPNEFPPRSRYMSNGQLANARWSFATGNGAGSRFGAQHSQSVENWCHDDPRPQGGGALQSARRDRADGSSGARPRPGDLLRAQNRSTPLRARCRTARSSTSLGTAADLRGLARTPTHPGARPDGAARARGGAAGLESGTWHRLGEVIDVRSLVPLDTQTILGSGRPHPPGVYRSRKIRVCAVGAPRSSRSSPMSWLYDLDGPPVRITTPNIPLPAADIPGRRRPFRPWTASRRPYGDRCKADARAPGREGGEAMYDKSARQCSDRSLHRRQVAQILRQPAL